MKETGIHKARSLKSSYITRDNSASLKLHNRELYSTIDPYKMEKMPTYTLPFLSPSRGISELSMDGVASIKSGLHCSVIRYLNLAWPAPEVVEPFECWLGVCRFFWRIEDSAWLPWGEMVQGTLPGRLSVGTSILCNKWARWGLSHPLFSSLISSRYWDLAHVESASRASQCLPSDI